MKTLQKFGGVAALTGAATNLLAIVMFITLSPKGLGSDDPGQTAAFFADNLAVLRIWYVIIYLVFGVSLIFLSMALHERLNAGSPALVQAAAIFGLVWAALVIVMGTLSINDLGTVARLYNENPAQAVTIWSTLDSVETGLGNNGGETMINALWFLLLSWAAFQARGLPRILNYLGVVTGLAGILSVILALPALTAVYGLGLIIWLAWLGIVLLRGNPGKTA
jgi:hypothetical protein